MSFIDEYLNKLGNPEKEALERLRKIIRKTVPAAEETISYGMPAFKYKGRPLVYFAAFKDHLSLFPTSGPTEVLREELKDFKTSKGTIQFTLKKPLPESLIKKILAIRLSEIDK